MKLLTTAQVGKKLGGFSAVTVHNRTVDGTFPKPDKIEGRRRLWKAERVEKWIAKNGDLLASMKRRAKSRDKVSAKKTKKAKKKAA